MISIPSGSLLVIMRKRTSCSIIWKGDGLNEQGIDNESGSIVVKIDPRYYRPTEVDNLLGDPTKAKKELNWQHTITFKDMISEMVQEDIKLLQNE